MTETSTNKGNPIKRWFAGRLEHRIDRLWLGGVGCVSLLVTVLLDFRFIAIFLVGYFFIFVLRNREKIQSVFPPAGNIAYGYANEITNPHVSLSEKKKSYWKFHWFMFPIFLGFILVYPFFPSGSVYFSGAGVSALIANVAVFYFFVIKHQLLFSCYVGDCLIYRMGTHVGTGSGSINLMAGGFKFIRPFGTVLLIACLWGVALTGYVNATARIYEHYSGLNGGLAILSGPVFISLFLFLTCLTALLSWEESNG